MFLNNRKSCSTFQDCSLALGFSFTLQELVFLYLLPREALKGTHSKWELGRSGTVFSSAHPLLRGWLGAVRGCPGKQTLMFAPGNTQGTEDGGYRTTAQVALADGQRQGRYSTGMLKSKPETTSTSAPFCSLLGFCGVKSHMQIQLLMRVFVTISYLYIWFPPWPQNTNFWIYSWRVFCSSLLTTNKELRVCSQRGKKRHKRLSAVQCATLCQTISQRQLWCWGVLSPCCQLRAELMQRDVPAKGPGCPCPGTPPLPHHPGAARATSWSQMNWENSSGKTGQDTGVGEASRCPTERGGQAGHQRHRELSAISNHRRAATVSRGRNLKITEWLLLEETSEMFQPWAGAPSPRTHPNWPQTLPVLGHSQLLWAMYSCLIATTELCSFKERFSHHWVKASCECRYLWESWERDQEGKRENCALSPSGDSRKVRAGGCSHFWRGSGAAL